MKQRQTIIVYGDSLMLAGVQTSLGLDPAFEVIAHPLPITAQELQTLRPRAVIFDIQAVQPEFHSVLAQELPGLLLIGLDPSTNRGLVWSGKQLREQTVQDLTQVIQGRPGLTRHLDRLRRGVPALALTRKQKLALAVTAIGLCSVLVVAQWTTFYAAGDAPNALLRGAAVSATPTPELGLTVAAGLVLGGILIGLWVRQGRRRARGRSKR